MESVKTLSNLTTRCEVMKRRLFREPDLENNEQREKGNKVLP